MRRTIVAALCATLAAACDAPNRGEPSYTSTALGSDRYFAAFAFREQVVVGRTGPTAEEPSNEFAETTWHLLDPRGGEPTLLPLPPKASCDETEYLDGFALSETELGFARDCVVRDETGYATHENDLVAYDPRTRRVRVVAEDPIPAQYVVLGDGDVLASHDSAFCTYFARYRAGRRVPLDLALDRDGWPLDLRSNHPDCADTGLAALPAVDAAGRLAFVASTAAKGKAGTERIAAEWAVYVVDGGVARRIADAPGRPLDLTWTVDGTTLLLSVEGEDAGVYGVTPNGDVRRVLPMVAADIAAFDGFLVVLEDADDSLVQRLLRVTAPGVAG